MHCDIRFKYTMACKHLISVSVNIVEGAFLNLQNILSVNEKLPASKFQYFGKYIVQLFGYCYVHVSGQRQTGLER